MQRLDDDSEFLFHKSRVLEIRERGFEMEGFSTLSELVLVLVSCESSFIFSRLIALVSTGVWGRIY